MKKPYKWQSEAHDEYVEAEAFCLAADCGTGKSFATVWIAKDKGLPTLIIAPGHNLCDQWKDELLANGVAEEDIWVYNKPEETKQGLYYRDRFEEWLYGKQDTAKAS